MKIQYLNNKGSILQIVLIIFLLFIGTLSIGASFISLQSSSYKDIDLMMKQKNIEILLTQYYLTTLKDDVLIGEVYQQGNWSITSDIEDLASSILIDTEIKSSECHYHYILEVSDDYETVLSYKYEEE